MGRGHERFNRFKQKADATLKEEFQTWDMQIREFVKYLRPDNPAVVSALHYGTFRLMEMVRFS